MKTALKSISRRVCPAAALLRRKYLAAVLQRGSGVLQRGSVGGARSGGPPPVAGDSITPARRPRFCFSSPLQAHVFFGVVPGVWRVIWRGYQAQKRRRANLIASVSALHRPSPGKPFAFWGVNRLPFGIVLACLFAWWGTIKSRGRSGRIPDFSINRINQHHASHSN